MTPGNKIRLTVNYPNLYRIAYNEGYAFPFECGDGWYDVIEYLSKRLEQMILPFLDRPGVDLESIPCAAQVKEKWGMLCFYMSSSTEEMDKAIQEIEDLSAEICEVCGKPGHHNTLERHKVRCEEHKDD